MDDWLSAEAWKEWALNPNTQETAKLTVLSGLAWAALELLSNLVLRGWFMRLLDNNPALKGKPDKIAATATQAMPRVVCFVHNLIQVPLGLVILTDPAFQADPIFHTTPLSRAIVAISSGYFLYDTCECILRFSHEGVEFLLHGVFCFIVYCLLLHLNILHFFGAGFLMWEMSTPFLHLRWFLYKAGSDGALYTTISVMGMFVFFGCRNFWGIYLSVRYWFASSSALATPAGRAALPMGVVWFFRSALVVLNGLNTMWAYKMVEILVGQVRGALGKSGLGKREAAVRKQALKALKTN